MNYINYVQHSLYHPPEFWRDFRLDLDWCQGITKRVFLASLPFIAMYGPAGKALSILGNGSRAFSHLQQGIEEQEKKRWKHVAWECAKVALALIALGATLFNFTTGIFISTASDLAHGVYHTGQALYNGLYPQAGEEALQTLASAAYLGFMISGSLELIFCFALLQTATAFCQAAVEIFNKRYIEAAAKIGLCLLKAQGARGYIQAIERRNLLLQQERTAPLFAKIAKARQALHLLNHPLSSLQQRVEENDLVFTESGGNEVHLGANFHGNGGTLVKGENIVLRSREVEGQEVIELEFKVNHAFRGQLEASVEQLQKINPKEMGEILQLTGSHATRIQVKQVHLLGKPISWFSANKDAHQIVVGELGEIFVGADQKLPNLYDKVILRIAPGQTLYSLHEMLCLLDLENAICLSTKEDLERLKMGQLFRTFFPREALNFERSLEFFTMPLAELKEKMIEKAPEMGEIFDRYYDKMVPETILGGRVRYRICGLSDAVYQAGGRALTAAVTGTNNDQELFARVASMIRMGMLATEVRQANNLNKGGLSPGFDYLTGGADSVYTQMITEQACKNHTSLNQLYYSKVRLLISLDVLELGSYQYPTDSFGSRTHQGPYHNRKNILEFTRGEQEHWHSGNEVMLKERIPPSFFTGLIVSDEQKKADLIQYLKKYDLIEEGRILGHAVDQFIRVGTHLSEELVS